MKLNRPFLAVLASGFALLLCASCNRTEVKSVKVQGCHGYIWVNIEVGLAIQTEYDFRNSIESWYKNIPPDTIKYIGMNGPGDRRVFHVSYLWATASNPHNDYTVKRGWTIKKGIKPKWDVSDGAKGPVNPCKEDIGTRVIADGTEQLIPPSPHFDEIDDPVLGRILQVSNPSDSVTITLVSLKVALSPGLWSIDSLDDSNSTFMSLSWNELAPTTHVILPRDTIIMDVPDDLIDPLYNCFGWAEYMDIANPVDTLTSYYWPQQSPESMVLIPTLTEWGMIIFCVLLFGWMAWVIVRRRRAGALRM